MKRINSTENESVNLQMKNAVFWDVAPFLRNVGPHKIYTAPHPRDGILHSHRRENRKPYN
jgi:hypothetical protein